jgi:hypothetical protein
MTTLRVRVPAQVQAPRGAIAAAALMVRLLRGIASVTTTVLASAGGSGATKPPSAPHD